jgi:hypothetical protein
MKSFWESETPSEFKRELQTFADTVIRPRLAHDCRFFILVLPDNGEGQFWASDLPCEADAIRELEVLLTKLKGKENK